MYMNISPSNFNNEKRESYLSPSTTSPEQETYEPKWKHLEEDLKYMFGIEITSEEDLYSEETKKKMYDLMLKDMQEESPFSLDYFIEEGLLSKNDIKDEDIKTLKPCALKILNNLRNITHKSTYKNLFIDLGILTQEEVASAVLH